MTPNELATVLDEVVPPLYREEVDDAIRAHVASEILKHDASIRADEIKRRTRAEAAIERTECEHSWRFDGDDPYVICVHCDEMQDALTGRVVRKGSDGTP